MKIRKVTKAKESGYPTYSHYLRDHKKELGIIVAGVGLMLTPGCDKKDQNNTNAPKPPIVIPVDKGVDVEGDMAVATPPKPQRCDRNATAVGGKIKAPTPPQVRGRCPATKPVVTKGEMPAPKMLGKIAAPKPPSPPKKTE